MKHLSPLQIEGFQKFMEGAIPWKRMGSLKQPTITSLAKNSWLQYHANTDSVTLSAAGQDRWTAHVDYMQELTVFRKHANDNLSRETELLRGSGKKARVIALDKQRSHNKVSRTQEKPATAGSEQRRLPTGTTRGLGYAAAAETPKARYTAAP